MILYTSIKYKIFDICLDALFNGFFKNFLNNGKFIPLRELRTGMELQSLRLPYAIFYDCLIRRIDLLGKDKDGNIVYYIEFKYRKSDDELLDVSVAEYSNGLYGTLVYDAKLSEGDAEIILK